jgi:hypothetical protein
MVIYEFFLIWSLPFWILLGAEFFFLFWCVSCRRGFTALASLVVLAAAVQFFGDIPVFQYLWHNPMVGAIGLGVWLAVSAPWAFVKWTLFVRDNSCRYDELLAEFVEHHAGYPKNANEFTVDQKVEWKEYFDRNCRCDEWFGEFDKVEFDPSPKTHKSDIMTWMMLWPWSLGWTLLNDPIRKFFRHAYYFMVGRLERIRDYYWKDKRGHMPTQAEIDEYHRKKQEKAQEERDRWQKEREAAQNNAQFRS